MHFISVFCSSYTVTQCGMCIISSVSYAASVGSVFSV